MTMKIFDEQLTPSEAKELLLDVLQCTVSFYKVKNWRHVMHYGIPDPIYNEKLNQLEKTRQEVLAQVEESINSGVDLIKIISSLNILLQRNEEKFAAATEAA